MGIEEEDERDIAPVEKKTLIGDNKADDSYTSDKGGTGDYTSSEEELDSETETDSEESESDETTTDSEESDEDLDKETNKGI
jgi:hypothetical protein